MRILVVEDELAARRGLARVIEEAGIPQEDIILAADGQQGLAQLHAHAPEIAFIDIQMPHMSGLEMIRQARKLDMQTVFVLTSAYSEFEYAKEAMHLGVKEYLVKPIAPEDVATLLAPYISRKDKADGQACHPMVRRMLQIIEADYAKPINLTTISEDLNLTPEYLSYLFRRDMGVNFSAYLRQVRIDRAFEMMQKGATRVYDIAHAVGFSDTKYFCRVFREVTGRSPGSYLKELSAVSSEEEPS